MRRLYRLLFIWLLPVVSCSISGPLREDRSAKNFQFPPPPSGWSSEKPDEGAQRLYRHDASGDVLSVSSICDRYETAALDKLARSALTPLGFYTEKENKTFKLVERDAQEIFANGKVDGVTVEVDLVVVRKNDCIFDFSLQGSPTLAAPVRAEFMKLVRGFKY